MNIDSRKWMTPFPRYKWQVAINLWLFRRDPARQALIAEAEAEFKAALAVATTAPSPQAEQRLRIASLRMFNA